MADNVTLPGTGQVVGSDDCAGVQIQQVKLIDGTLNSTTGIPGDATNGLDVDVTRLPTLIAGTAVIGKVGIDQTTPGTTNLVQVGGSLPAGTANIGDVDVLSVPADPFGANADAAVAAGAAGSIQAKLRRITQALEDLKSLTVLAAGTNAIGKLAANSGVDIGDVDVISVPTDPFGANADAASATGSISAKLRFIAATGIPVTGNVATAGDVAHDAADSGNPVKVGYKAIAHGANPTAVAAADRTHAYANRHGIPFMIGGHPNILTLEFEALAIQTNAAIITAGSGTKIVVTQIIVHVARDSYAAGTVSATAGVVTLTGGTWPIWAASGSITILGETKTVATRNSNSQITLDDTAYGVSGGKAYVLTSDSGETIAFRVGFGSSTTPTTTGVLLGTSSLSGEMSRGDGAGIIGIGGDGEDLRITTDTFLATSLRVYVSYYTIES